GLSLTPEVPISFRFGLRLMKMERACVQVGFAKCRPNGDRVFLGSRLSNGCNDDRCVFWPDRVNGLTTPPDRRWPTTFNESLRELAETVQRISSHPAESVQYRRNGVALPSRTENIKDSLR